MNTWMTFIGKDKYSMNSFAKEARAFGISRNIPKKMLKQMNTGDVVYVFMKVTDKKSVLFGSFVISGVTGEIPPEAMKKLEDEGKIEELDNGGDVSVVQRECGTYVMGSAHAMNCSISDIVDAVEESDKDARLMVAGRSYEDHENIPTSMKSIRGFRLFDYDQFMDEWNQIKHRARPVVKNYCYGKKVEKGFAVNEKGELIEITNYVKR